MEADIELMREETSDAEQDIYDDNEIVLEDNESHENTNEQIQTVPQFQLNQKRRPRKSDKVLFYSEENFVTVLIFKIASVINTVRHHRRRLSPGT